MFGLAFGCMESVHEKCILMKLEKDGLSTASQTLAPFILTLPLSNKNVISGITSNKKVVYKYIGNDIVVIKNFYKTLIKNDL